MNAPLLLAALSCSAAALVFPASPAGDPAAGDPAAGDTGAAELEPLAIGPHLFQRRLLANGLRAVAVRDEGETVSVFVVIGAGNRQESVETSGLAHLTEHAMFAGTPTTGVDAHERTVEGWGGESNAFTRDDYTLFYDHDVPRERLAEVLAMEADRLRNLTFDEEAVLRERHRLEVEEAHTHQPSDGRDQELEAAVYRAHAYRVGVPDADGHTRGPELSVAQVKAFYDRYYHPDRTCVVAAGPLEPDAMLDAIEAAFGALPRGPAAPPPPVEAWVREPRTERIPSNLPRDRYELTWLVPAMGDSARPALLVLANLLGRRQLSAGNTVPVEMTDRVDRELLRVAASGEGLLDELRTLVEEARSERPDAGQLEEVKGLLRDQFAGQPLRARPYFSLAGTFGVYEVLGHARLLAEHPAAIDAVTADDVYAAARRWLDPARCVTVVFEGTGEEVPPLPEDPNELQRAAMDAADAGDYQRAIDAYTKLLEKDPSRMNQVIFLATRGQLHMERRDFNAAIADYEAALVVVDYPAVRELLEQAHARKAAALRGEFEEGQPAPGGGDGDGDSDGDGGEGEAPPGHGG